MKLTPNVRLAVIVALLCTAPVLADQLYSLGFPRGDGTFNVIDGKPYLLRRGEQGSPGNAVDFKDGNKLVHLASRKGLAYPLEGTNPVVSLGKTDGATEVWDLSAFGDGESRGSPVRAAEGKFKGWYLDWSDEEFEITSGGKTFHARPLILVKEPKTVRMFSKYPVAK